MPPKVDPGTAVELKLRCIGGQPANMAILAPKLGPLGAGLAVLIQGITSFSMTTIFITFKSEFKLFKLLNFRRCSGDYIKKMLKII